MSILFASPELMSGAASNLANIGSSITAAAAAAAPQTTQLLAAGADEVSIAITAFFEAHASSYQSLSAHAAAFHDQLVQALAASSVAYAHAEAANASPLQMALDALNAPTLALLGRPLIANGANGTPGTGAAGHAGGILVGNGGNGGSGAAGQNGGAGGAAGCCWAPAETVAAAVPELPPVGPGATGG
ncbi:PE family protein, partial [Mycobacterium szulgai]|nr:PE family protein [Mycobacterium szulgai]